MTTLFQILLYVWIAITAMMIATWVLRRRSAKADRATDPGAVKLNLGQTADDDTEAEEDAPAPHPALVGAEAEHETVEVDVEPANETSTNFFATTTTDTIDIDAELLDDPANDAESSNETPIDENDSTEYDDETDSEDKNKMAVETAVLPMLQPQTLIDMLDGIKLPYDLTPVTAAVEDPDRHLIFLTTHSNAEEVGTQFADELIGLGYEFEPVGLDQAIATRGDDTISMTIVPDASEVHDANGARYGAAGRGDVALELWTGDSPNPPSAID